MTSDLIKRARIVLSRPDAQMSDPLIGELADALEAAEARIKELETGTFYLPGIAGKRIAAGQDIATSTEGAPSASVPAPSATPIGGNTGHGHVWPRPDGIKARCGGPTICHECALDAARTAQLIKQEGGDAHDTLRLPRVDVTTEGRGSVTNALPPYPDVVEISSDDGCNDDADQDDLEHVARTDYNKLRTAAEALQRESAQLRADAERYRKVRRNPAMLLHLTNSEFDAAIDAARKGE